MKTATSEMVMETMVKPISREPFRAAASAVSPFSICRTIFSSMTMASSTTKPTARVSAIMEMLLTENPSRCMTEKVPTIDIGTAREGMMVAERFLRKRKITMTTSPMVKKRVCLTSSIDSRIRRERS